MNRRMTDRLLAQLAETRWNRNGQLGLVVGLAMLAHVISAALLGAFTPIIVKKLRGDPAMISTPAVTGIADFTGAAIYVVLIMALLS